jgi:peptidyl-prolyl cis-trans isomerase SurA
VIAGESFKTLAVMYSLDPGSAKKGGELGFFERGMMVPEFDAVAFKLRGNTVSEVFETEYGFHFMQLIERRGDQINVRHILIQAKLSAEDLERSRLLLDSVYELISTGKMTFEKAAEKFSDDENSKQNGGLMFNPQTNTTKFETDLLSYIDKKLIFTIDRMKVGELSRPVLTTSPDNKESYSLFMLRSRTEPHRANLKDDYQRIQKVAEMDKQNRQVGEWVGEKAAKTFIRIDDEFKDCDFNNRWIN